MKVEYTWSIQAGHEGTSNMKNYPKCPWYPLLLHCFCSPSLYLWSQGSSLWSSDRGREVLGTKGPFWDIPKGQWGRISPSGHNFKQHILFYTLLGRRNGQTWNYVSIHGRWPIVLLKIHGLGKNKIRKLMTKKFGEDICRYTYVNWQKTHSLIIFVFNVFTKEWSH